MMKNILIVEDDTAHMNLLQTALKKYGYSCTSAFNGMEGLKLFRQEPCYLVIMDIFMPEKEGLETILELKSEFPTTKIIAISGGGICSASYALSIAQSFGADHIFEKPIKISLLMEKVKELLE